MTNAETAAANTETANGVTVSLEHLPVRKILDAQPAQTFLHLNQFWRLIAIQHARPGELLEWQWMLHSEDKQARVLFNSALDDGLLTTVQGRFAENKYGLYCKVAKDMLLPSFLRRYVEHNEASAS